MMEEERHWCCEGGEGILQVLPHGSRGISWVGSSGLSDCRGCEGFHFHLHGEVEWIDLQGSQCSRRRTCSGNRCGMGCLKSGHEMKIQS